MLPIFGILCLPTITGKKAGETAGRYSGSFVPLINKKKNPGRVRKEKSTKCLHLND